MPSIFTLEGPRDRRFRTWSTQPSPGMRGLFGLSGAEADGVGRALIGVGLGLVSIWGWKNYGAAITKRVKKTVRKVRR